MTLSFEWSRARQDQPGTQSATAVEGEGEERMLLAMEIVADGGYVWNVVTGSVMISERLLTLFGFSQAEFGSIEQFAARLHPDERGRVAASFQDHLAGRSEHVFGEFRLLDGTDAWRWVRTRGRVVERQPNGAPLRLIGAAVDITEQRGLEEEARKASELIGLAQRGAGAGTWELDLQAMRATLCSRSHAMHGLQVDEGESIAHAQWRECLVPDDVAPVEALLSHAIRTREIYSAQYRTRTPDGMRWVHALGRAIHDQSGLPERFVGLNLDITERKTQEAELLQAQSDLHQVDRLNAMGMMATTLAHELNQPLTAVANYAAGLRRMALRDGADAAVLEGLDEIVLSGLRAGEIIRRLRTYVATGALQLKEESLDGLVREAVRLALNEEQQSAIRLNIDLDDADTSVLADRIQLQQVFCNLLRNAGEALADHASPAIRIRSSRLGEDKLRVEISDNGAGIPEDVRARLFSPFTTSKEQGMGVGLALCRTIVEGHGGTIWAEPAAEGGACFAFTLSRAVPG